MTIRNKGGNVKIGLFAIGEVDSTLLNRVVCGLEERFFYRFFIESSLSLPSNAFNSAKKQYFAPTLLSNIKMIFPSEIKYAMGITQADLYGVSLNYIFGDANPEERTGIVSYHRLRPEFYNHPPDFYVVCERLLKESTHQLAHLLGGKHCYNRMCVMYYSSNIYDIDQKTSLFCSECEKRLKKIAAHDRSSEPSA